MAHVPYLRRPAANPATDTDAAAAEARDRFRRDAAAARAAAAPHRRAVLATGPQLRDVDAAVDCVCACHPRPADAGLHGGGTSCPCQQTPEERAAAWRELAAYFESLPTVAQSGGDDLRAAASRLGVDLGTYLMGAPFVVSGVVDGRGFFLRERHDVYRVEVAGDEHPSADPWTHDPEVATFVVADGTSDEFIVDGRFDEVAALETAVSAVRLFLLRRDCAHDGAARFCPHCGVELADADAWHAPPRR